MNTVTLMIHIDPRIKYNNIGEGIIRTILPPIREVQIMPVLQLMYIHIMRLSSTMIVVEPIYQRVGHKIHQIKPLIIQGI